jgi:hypothetical protein
MGSGALAFRTIDKLFEFLSGFRRGFGEFVRHFHQIGERISPHLLHDLASMSLDGDLADSQLAAHLLVQKAVNDQFHDLLFALRE